MSERCGRCNRKLSDPKSQELGFGPVCWGQITSKAPVTKPAPSRQLEQLELDFETKKTIPEGARLIDQYKIIKKMLDK